MFQSPATSLSWSHRSSYLPIRAILTVLLVVLGVTASADVYRWVDEDGKVHFGDKPPRDVESESVTVGPTKAPESPDEGELRRRHLLEQAEKDAARRIESRREKSDAERTRRAARAARAQRCLEGRKHLAVLGLQLPVYRDEDGGLRAKWLRDTYRGPREYLDDDARAVEIERARRNVAADCEHPDDAQEQARARMLWMKSEACAASRVELEALERPSARASREKLEDKRREVTRYCAE